MVEAAKENLFGFSTEPSGGGDFTPIIKYDARAGRVFRVDREQTTDGFASNPVDVTSTSAWPKKDHTRSARHRRLRWCQSASNCRRDPR